MKAGMMGGSPGAYEINCSKQTRKCDDHKAGSLGSSRSWNGIISLGLEQKLIVRSSKDHMDLDQEGWVPQNSPTRCCSVWKQKLVLEERRDVTGIWKNPSGFEGYFRRLHFEPLCVFGHLWHIYTNTLKWGARGGDFAIIRPIIQFAVHKKEQRTRHLAYQRAKQ